MELYSSRIVSEADEWKPYERLAEFSRSCSGVADGSTGVADGSVGAVEATGGSTGAIGAVKATGSSTGATGAVGAIGAVDGSTGATGAVGATGGSTGAIGAVRAIGGSTGAVGAIGGSTGAIGAVRAIGGSTGATGAVDGSTGAVRATDSTTGATGAVDGTTGSVGAIASFIGLVRGSRGLESLILEHYPTMTESALQGLCTQAQKQWQLTGCLIEHRVGKLPVGTPIVLVACGSAHRAEALAACQFLIDRLKSDAPFWKREIFADGTEQWVTPRSEDVQKAKG